MKRNKDTFSTFHGSSNTFIYLYFFIKHPPHRQENHKENGGSKGNSQKLAKKFGELASKSKNSN